MIRVGYETKLLYLLRSVGWLINTHDDENDDDENGNVTKCTILCLYNIYIIIPDFISMIYNSESVS